MCFNKYANVQKNDELTSEEIKDFLDQVIKLCSKDARVMISGGEPLITMNKTLEAAKYAKSLGFKVVSIVTNGTLVTKDFAKKVKELDIKIMVSLDGTNEKDHDFIRGKGVFKKTIRGIKILTEEGVKVQTNFMVHRGNINKLKEYYELAKDFDLYSARFISLKMLGGALETKDLELVPIDEILEKSYNLFIKYPEFRKYSGSNIFSTFAHNCKLAVKRGWCGTGRLMVVLDSDGAIYPCSCHAFPQFLAGNIRKEKFVDIWTKSTVLKKLRKIYNVDNINKKCSNCIVKHWCLGCKAEAYQVTKKLNSPDIQCKKMKKSIIWMMWKIFENPDLGKSTRSIETEYVTH